jgi:hypothetical protein
MDNRILNFEEAGSMHSVLKLIFVTLAMTRAMRFVIEPHTLDNGLVYRTGLATDCSTEDMASIAELGYSCLFLGREGYCTQGQGQSIFELIESEHDSKLVVASDNGFYYRSAPVVTIWMPKYSRNAVRSVFDLAYERSTWICL